MLLSFPCIEATLSRYEVAKIMFLIMRKSELDFQMNKIDILASLARLFPRVIGSKIRTHYLTFIERLTSIHLICPYANHM